MELTTLGGVEDGQKIKRKELEECLEKVIQAVGVCGLLRLAHEHFAKHKNPARYNSYPAIAQVMMVAEGMVRQATVDVDDDQDDAANDEFEIDRFTEYGLLLHQLSE